MIVGDFNFNYLDPSGCEYKRFVNILDTFDFVQNIELPTHSSGHLLDYVITRKNSTYASNFVVSDFIGDHRVIHVSLKYMSSHPVRKLIHFRSLNRINEGSLVLDLDNIDITENKIVVIINNLKSKNSSGKDEISNKLLKSIKGEISKPLTIIINQCLETGIFPDALKVAKVKPLYIKGDNCCFNNYRPISLLPTISKIFERVMFTQLYSYFNINNLYQNSNTVLDHSIQRN